MRKILSVFSLVLLVCVLVSTSVMAADVVTFDSGATVEYAGEPLEIKIVINEAASVGYVTGTVYYDASVWSVSNISGISTLTKSGEIALNKSDFTDVSYGAGDAILSFTATALDEEKVENSTFRINQLTLADSTFGYMPYDGTGADIVLTVKAKTAEATKYTVTFDTAGGSAVASQEVEEGNFAIVPENPTKDGYTFKGWDKDIATTAITGPTTFTAQWEKIPVPPVFNGTSERTNVTGNDGKEYSNIFVGNYSITPNDKTWTGCKFYPDTVDFSGTKGDLTFKSGFNFEGEGTITFKTAIVGVPEGVGIIIEPVYAD